MDLNEIKELAEDGVTMIPVSKCLSADLLTPVAAFLRLRRQGEPCFLLESADGGEAVGRYSFLGRKPFATLVSKEGVLTYREKGKEVVERPKNLMKRIGEYLSAHKSAALSSKLPFQGGAIGYVAYDAAAFLEDISLKEAVKVGKETSLMFFENIIAFDRLKHQMYLISHIRPQVESLKKGLARAKNDIAKMEESLFSFSGKLAACELDNDAKPVKVKGSLGKESFLSAVKKIKEHIRAGDIFQCVLSEKFRLNLDDKDPFEIYRVLRTINPSPYLFFVDFGKEILLGSSPEMLVRVTGRLVETCPIAGTRPRGANEKEDKKHEKELLSSVKERAEHLMLVDLSRNDISRVAVSGSVAVKDFMHIGRFSHVMHIISLVTGKLKPSLSAWDAFCACFPAGTLSGAPKIKAMQIISSLEKERRGTYGGAVVAHDFLGNMNSCITIRSLWAKDGEGVIQAGAGVVADSHPAKEYEEVLNKAKAIRKAVALTKKAVRGSIS